MEYDLTKKATRVRLEAFAQELKEISEKVGFKQSARGWAYQLEVEGLITKEEFDKVENLINNCRKKGILPIDFTAEEEGRKFSGVEEPDTDTPIEDLRYWINSALTTEERYIPNWWEWEEYYIQMVVEKIDTKICVVCFVLFVVVTISLVIVEKQIPSEYIPIEDREPNLIVNGENVYCAFMSRNVFGTGIELNSCSNGREYYNVENVVRLG